MKSQLEPAMQQHHCWHHSYIYFPYICGHSIALVHSLQQLPPSYQLYYANFANVNSNENQKDSLLEFIHFNYSNCPFDSLSKFFSYLKSPNRSFLFCWHDTQVLFLKDRMAHSPLFYHLIKVTVLTVGFQRSNDWQRLAPDVIFSSMANSMNHRRHHVYSILWASH